MSIAKSFIEFYALRVPYHRGKWRVVEVLLRISGVEAEDAGKIFEVARGGIRWRLNTECSVQRRLFYHGEFDLHDFRELAARLPKDPVFLDIGAYFGYYALKIRHLAGVGATVHAFEPVPANFALLNADKALNGFDNLQTHQTALSNREGEVTFEIPPGDNGGVGHISHGFGSGNGTGMERVTVAGTTLDAFAERAGLTRIDAIKMDVEGAELSVIEGGVKTLLRHRPVLLMELNPPCLARFGTGPEPLLKRLSELGYAFFRATPSGLVPFGGLQPGEAYLNIFCIARMTQKLGAT